jgi:hypothetical protein
MPARKKLGPVEAKQCPTCGSWFERPKHDNGKWGTRRFSSKRCMRKTDNPKSTYINIMINGRVMHRSRWVMEQALGRRLRSDEHVHHKNHNTHDDRLENLEVLQASKHMSLHKRVQKGPKICPVCKAEFEPNIHHRIRQKTCSENCANKLKTETRLQTHEEEYRGIYFHARKKEWRAQIGRGGKKIWIGAFKTEAEARIAYERVRKELRNA